MRAAEFVEGLADQGVRLSVEGGDLKYRGPRSALTPETLDRLKARKAEVIAHLRPAPKVTPVEPPKVTPDAVRRLLDDPPYWLAGCYLTAWKGGRFSTRQLAYGVAAAVRLSPHDDEAVGEIVRTMRGLGYEGAPFARGLAGPEFGAGG